MKAGYVNTVSSACHQVVMLKAEASREKPAYPKIYLLFIEKKKDCDYKRFNKNALLTFYCGCV